MKIKKEVTLILFFVAIPINTINAICEKIFIVLPNNKINISNIIDKPVSKENLKPKNEIPADNDKYIGWLCPECNWHECDRCDEKIYCDEDITAYDVFDENKNFSDGAYRVHYECLTEEEKKLLEENQ